MLSMEFYDEERAIIFDALMLYLHTLKGEPYEPNMPSDDEEQHFDEDTVRNLIMRFEK